MDNYNYPCGADSSDAPWNQCDPEPKEVNVTVSITLSKQLTVEVDDYKEYTEQDEDGCYSFIDYSDCDLKKAVQEQINLPNEAYKLVLKDTKYYNDLKGWCVDDFEVILD